jgi:polyisoprenoid-binding protein YceI
VTFDASADGASATRLDVTVEMTTFDTDDKERNDTLRGPDLLDVAKFPQAHFLATQITKTATAYDWSRRNKRSAPPLTARAARPSGRARVQL